MLSKYSTNMKHYEYETKYDALKEIFYIENIPERWTSKKLTCLEFLGILSRDSYNIKELTGLSAQSISKLNKRLFPDKVGNTKVCTYLLHRYGLCYCLRCRHVYLEDYFHNNGSKSTGKQEYCKDCFNDKVRDMRREYEAARRAEKLNSTPIWANKAEIGRIYANCPAGHHVDHEVPLKGMAVCGLHVEHNLKYLSASDNIAKSNTFSPDSYTHSVEYTPPYITTL